MKFGKKAKPQPSPIQSSKSGVSRFLVCLLLKIKYVVGARSKRLSEALRMSTTTYIFIDQEEKYFSFFGGEKMLYQEIRKNEDFIDGVNSLSSSSSLTNQIDGYNLSSHNLCCS